MRYWTHYQLLSCLVFFDEKKSTLDIIVVIWFWLEYLVNIDNPIGYAHEGKDLQETICLLTGCGQQKNKSKTHTKHAGFKRLRMRILSGFNPAVFVISVIWLFFKSAFFVFCCFVLFLWGRGFNTASFQNHS